VPTTSLLAHAARFHGHLGPWLVLGLRAGRYASRVLRAGPFNLRAAVRCPSRPPHSCFIDGVQVGSGCTLGKANITRRRARCVEAGFTRTGSRPGAGLLISVRPELFDELRRTPDPERLAQDIFTRPFSRLFLVRRH